MQTDFWTKLAKKVSNRKSEHHHEILHNQISLGTKFCLKLTLLKFWTKLTQKGYFQSKKNENYHQILHIRFNLDSNFQLQQTILIFGTNFQIKGYFWSKTEKNEPHH